MLKGFAFFDARLRGVLAAPLLSCLPSSLSANSTCHSGWDAHCLTCLLCRSVRYTSDDELRLSDPLFVVNLALYLLLDRSNRATRTSATRASWAVALLTFVAVVIRAEIAGLLGLFTIQLLSDGSLSITRLVRVGIISTGISIGMTLFCPCLPTQSSHSDSIALTVLVDSYLWDHWPLWPEYFSIYFNVYEGKSAEWGVSVLFIACLSSHSLPCSGISILDLLHSFPPAPSHGHFAVHPERLCA
jgi:hypothetical protein